jgi:hypothetical protein
VSGLAAILVRAMAYIIVGKNLWRLSDLMLRFVIGGDHTKNAFTLDVKAGGG